MSADPAAIPELPPTSEVSAKAARTLDLLNLDIARRGIKALTEPLNTTKESR